MFRFTSDQKTFSVGGTNFGGQPGENPPVMVGSIFYYGHQIVSDAKKGVFDAKKAVEALTAEEHLSSETGLPRAVDVVGETSEALIRYVDFVAEKTSSPIVIDSPSRQARMDAVRHLARLGSMDRFIYNSIDENCTPEEIACLGEHSVKSAVLLACSAQALLPKQRLDLLRRTLLAFVAASGVERPLVDCGVLDLASVAWAAQSIMQVKDELGYPSGCAPSNALPGWKMKERGMPAYQAAVSAVMTLPISLGADFIFYGPIRNAAWTYPACATAAAMVAYGGRTKGTRPRSKDHPLFKVL